MNYFISVVTVVFWANAGHAEISTYLKLCQPNQNSIAGDSMQTSSSLALPLSEYAFSLLTELKAGRGVRALSL